MRDAGQSPQWRKRSTMLSVVVVITLLAAAMLAYDIARSCKGSMVFAYTSPLSAIMTTPVIEDGDEQCEDLLGVLLKTEPFAAVFGESRLAHRYRFDATALTVERGPLQCEISYRGRNAVDTLNKLNVLVRTIVTETEKLAISRRASMRRFATETLAEIAATTSGEQSASGPDQERKSPSAAGVERLTAAERELAAVRLNEALALTSRPLPETECRTYAERLEELTTGENRETQALCAGTLPLAVVRWPVLNEGCRAAP